MPMHMCVTLQRYEGDTYTHTHTHTYIHTNIHTHAHTYMHAYTHTYIQTWHIPIYIPLNIYTYSYVCTCRQWQICYVEDLDQLSSMYRQKGTSSSSLMYVWLHAHKAHEPACIMCMSLYVHLHVWCICQYICLCVRVG